MPSQKQVDLAMDDESGSAAASLLHHIRNMWEFANLCQWIYIFGKAAKIDETLEIEDIETECLKPSSTVLVDIGLALLKLLSSHRGLKHELFDEQLRKQYISRSPGSNPLGDGDTTSHPFSSLDIPTKIIVLQQLTQWIMSQPERLRDKMEEVKDIDQTSWRIEPYGWDADDRTYYVLDDNRVYRLSEAPEPPMRKPKKQKTYGSSRRSSKRRQPSDDPMAAEPVEDEMLESGGQQTISNLGGMAWECVAVTLDDVRGLVDGFRKTRDGNEKILREQLNIHLLPILEKQDESRKRKEAQRERELLSLAKMATAKRSSRIAGKIEQQKEEERAKEEQQKGRKELEDQRQEDRRRIKLERERDFRMFSREKRLKERASRRQQHEEELTQLFDGQRSTPDGPTRISDRQLQSEIDRNRQALKELEDEEAEWTFDCICGLYGQVDDGAHSVACESCNVWQHSSCVGIEESEADRADFHFICESCKRRIQEADTPRKTIIKLKVKNFNCAIPHISDSVIPNTTLPTIADPNGLATGMTPPEARNHVSGDMPSTKSPDTGLVADSVGDSTLPPILKNITAIGTSFPPIATAVTVAKTASEKLVQNDDTASIPNVRGGEVLRSTTVNNLDSSQLPQKPIPQMAAPGNGIFNSNIVAEHTVQSLGTPPLSAAPRSIGVDGSQQTLQNSLPPGRADGISTADQIAALPGFHKKIAGQDTSAS